MGRTFLNLGRTGDIVSFLPVLKNEYDESGERPSLIVAKEYADILDGVSYVNPIVYDGEFTDIEGALNFAKTLGKETISTQVVGMPDVIVSQVYGVKHSPKIICDSFQKDIFRLAGKLELWVKQPPLIFDNRDKRRESELLKGIPTKKPWIIVSTGGISSPFPWVDLLNELLTHSLMDFHVVDLSKIKARRFYDILGIMEHPNTHSMILTDSANLHLSCAANKPVHALIADSPSMWHGSAYRPSYASYTRYKNFPRDIMRILGLIRNPPVKPRHQNIVHVYQRTPWAKGDEKKRNEIAAKTWEGIGWVDLGLDDNCFVRNSSNVIPKETRNIPMIKDMLRMACIGRSDSDILVLTNSDTCVCSDIIARIKAHIPSFSYRRDFEKLDGPIPDSEIANGKWYAGSDLFVFTVGWWRANHHLYPDMVLGRHSWDRLLRILIQQSQGKELINSIYHHKHPSAWEHPNAINSDRSNLRNCALARKWLQDRKMPLEEIENLNYEGKNKIKQTSR